MSLKQSHNQNLDTLEKMIDENTIIEVLDLLAEVCSAKADHVRTNWQDETLGQAWDESAARILNCRFSFAQSAQQAELLTGGVRKTIKDEQRAIALNLWRSKMPRR